MIAARWPEGLDDLLEQLVSDDDFKYLDNPNVKALDSLINPKKYYVLNGVVHLSDQQWRTLDRFAENLVDRAPEDRIFAIPDSGSCNHLLATLLPDDRGRDRPTRLMSTATGGETGWQHSVRLNLLILDDAGSDGQ